MKTSWIGEINTISYKEFYCQLHDQNEQARYFFFWDGWTKYALIKLLPSLMELNQEKRQ